MKRWLRTIWYVLSLRCEEADRLRAEDAAALTRAQRIGESMHRVLCGSCRKARRQAALLKELLGELGEDQAGPALSDEARTRIAGALRRDIKPD